MIVHNIKFVEDTKTKCGKDTVNVANDNEKLTVSVFMVTCEKCRNLMPEINEKLVHKKINMTYEEEFE